MSWDSLYPFNEGTNVVSKAFMPVGNVPIINSVLDWVLDSGLTGTFTVPSLLLDRLSCIFPSSLLALIMIRYPHYCPCYIPFIHLEPSRRELLIDHLPSRSDRSQKTFGR